VLTYLGPLFRPVAKGGRVARPLNVAWPMPDGIGRVRVSFFRSHAQLTQVAIMATCTGHSRAISCPRYRALMPARSNPRPGVISRVSVPLQG
jgi:hypothetical protein